MDYNRTRYGYKITHYDFRNKEQKVSEYGTFIQCQYPTIKAIDFIRQVGFQWIALSEFTVAIWRVKVLKSHLVVNEQGQLIA